MQPLYIRTYQYTRFAAKIDALNKIFSRCSLCPRRCNVNRLNGAEGFCKATKLAVVASYYAHFGEEKCLVGECGSGTIFFSYCNLRCVFCQNYELSYLAEGKEVSAEELSGIMLKLQDKKCHNINLVTPTHFAPQILEALKIAVENGLALPLVYNCSGYESEEAIDILDGIVDIYMPDAKFSSPDASTRFCNAPDYFENLKKILKKMYAQVGDLEIIDGVAQKGLLVRHLVMPQGLAGTGEIMKFIAEEISPHTYVNIMDQYRPCAHADNFPEINRPITKEEYLEAKKIASSFGLHRFD